MKKWLTFPKITILFLVLFAIGVLYSNLNSDPNKPTPKKFVLDTLPQIVSQWDPVYATPIFKFAPEEVSAGLQEMKNHLGTCVVDKVTWGGQTSVDYINPEQSRYTYIGHLTCNKNGQSRKAKMLVAVNGEFKYVNFRF